MRNLLAACCFVLFGSLVSLPAQAQAPATVKLCNGGQPNCPVISSGNPLPVTGTFTASLGGFTPSASGARGTPLTVTTADSSGSLPSGVVVAVSNVGTNPMYCNVNGIAATVADQLITSGGGWFAFTIPSGITTLHCIATGGSTTSNTVGGSGLPTGTGGGSGGGSSSNASVSATGSAVPASATYFGMLVAGNLTGVPGTANGLKVDGSSVTQPVSVASGAAVLGSLVDINNGTNTPWPGTGTTSLLGGVFGVYNQLVALNTVAGQPAPCKAAATWNASTGLTGTQPTACDGSAAPWVDMGAVGGTIVGTFGTPPGAVPAVPVNAYPSLGTLALGSAFVSGTTAAMTGTSPTQIVALVASKRLYINRVKCNNSSGTATLVQITDGSAGTVLDTLAAGATYGGEAGVGNTPLFWTTAGNGLYAQDVTTGASVICTASGYSG